MHMLKLLCGEFAIDIWKLAYQVRSGQSACREIKNHSGTLINEVVVIIQTKPSD